MFHSKKVKGAIIMRILPNTPAADAGLRRHDVVIEMGGRPIRTAEEAKLVVDESGVGDVLTVKVNKRINKQTKTNRQKVHPLGRQQQQQKETKASS